MAVRPTVGTLGCLFFFQTLPKVTQIHRVPPSQLKQSRKVHTPRPKLRSQPIHTPWPTRMLRRQIKLGPF